MTDETRDGAALRRSFLAHCGRPLVLGLILFLGHLLVPPLLPDEEPADLLAHIFALAMIGTVAWFMTGLVRLAEEQVRDRFRVDVSDNLQARRVHTQTEVIRKILVVVIGVVAIGIALMTFDSLREIGTGLLASAGIAGIILGFAAQRSLSNLLAGIQIALTQPIRLDDVVVVEGEWGRIEEITLTYVVVRIWDLRRLVLPISWFIENPFQNWTRTSASILGTVFLYADYRVPFEEVRKELERLLKESPHWDGEVCRLHITEATPRTVELRCLMSAEDSGTAWELRCEIREKMLAWLQREHPESLPRVRAELEPVGEEEHAEATRA